MMVKDPGMDDHSWVTLLVTNDEVEARLKEGLLQGEGIECILESSIYRPRSVTPLYNQFTLLVKNSQRTEAQKILSDVPF